MKSIVIIILMFLYLIPAIGITVSTHYCGGKITSVSINPFDTKDKCSCGSKKMSKDCCKDVSITFKLYEQQQKTQPISCDDVKIPDFQPVIATRLTINHNSSLISTGLIEKRHPPDDLKHPLYIRHCVFRI